MKTRFLIERIKDSLSSVFKTKKGELKKKPVLFATLLAVTLALVFSFFVFSGWETPRQTQMGGSSLSLNASPKNTLPETTLNVRQAASRPFSQATSQANNPRSNNMSLEIVPGQAYAGTVLRLSAAGFNLADAQIEWMVNGMDRVTGSPFEFDTKDLVKGDVIQAAAGINGMEVKSGSVTIGDAPLEMESVRFAPGVSGPGGKNLYVDARAAGRVTKIVYEWTVNGKFAGDSNSLGAPVKRGDDITVKVTPCGAQGCGQPVVLRRQIVNMPPMFSRQVSATFDGTLYTAQLSATDPDGDPVTYSLEGAPDGMKIDASSGLIEWKVPQGVKGALVTAIASDGHGGTSRMALNIKPK